MLYFSFMEAMEDTLNPILLGLFFIATCSICLSGFSIVMVRTLISTRPHSCTSYFLCYSSSSLLIFFLHSWPPSFLPFIFLFYLFIPSSPSPLLSLSLCFSLVSHHSSLYLFLLSLLTFLSFFTFCSLFLSHSLLSFTFYTHILLSFFFFVSVFNITGPNSSLGHCR
jgi:hypothetical protein